MKFKPRKSNICILNSEKQTVTGGKLYFTPKFISSTNVFEGLEWDGWIWYAERAKVDFRASELHHIKLNLNLQIGIAFCEHWPLPSLTFVILSTSNQVLRIFLPCIVVVWQDPPIERDCSIAGRFFIQFFCESCNFQTKVATLEFVGFLNKVISSGGFNFAPACHGFFKHFLTP